jgi:hypothetical protein
MSNFMEKVRFSWSVGDLLRRPDSVLEPTNEATGSAEGKK